MLCDGVVMQVHNSAGKRISKAVTIAGKKQRLTLCRMVFKLDKGTQWPPSCDSLMLGTSTGAAPARKKGSKRSKSAGPPQTRQQACGGEVVVAGAKKVLSEEVQSGKGGIFALEALREPLSDSGRYGKLL
jgi:hypothetical protein